MSEPEARTAWITELLKLRDGVELHDAIRQMLIDVLDVVEQSGLECFVIDALAAFDGKISD